jgi:hypothetical protein
MLVPITVLHNQLVSMHRPLHCFLVALLFIGSVLCFTSGSLPTTTQLCLAARCLFQFSWDQKKQAWNHPEGRTSCRMHTACCFGSCALCAAHCKCQPHEPEVFSKPRNLNSPNVNKPWPLFWKPWSTRLKHQWNWMIQIIGHWKIYMNLCHDHLQILFHTFMI